MAFYGFLWTLILGLLGVVFLCLAEALHTVDPTISPIHVLRNSSLSPNYPLHHIKRQQEHGVDIVHMELWDDSKDSNDPDDEDVVVNGEVFAMGSSQVEIQKGYLKLVPGNTQGWSTHAKLSLATVCMYDHDVKGLKIPSPLPPCHESEKYFVRFSDKIKAYNVATRLGNLIRGNYMAKTHYNLVQYKKKDHGKPVPSPADVKSIQVSELLGSNLRTTFKRWIKHGDMPNADIKKFNRLKMFKSLLESMVDLHSKGVTHGDLAYHNIAIRHEDLDTSHWVFVIIDWDSAQFVQPAQGLSISPYE